MQGIDVLAKAGTPIGRALEFAQKAHGSQKRKWSGDPYVVHPYRVAARLRAIKPDCPDEMVVAALLHDVVEDTEVTLDDIGREFGMGVASYVDGLTNVSSQVEFVNLNREGRKRLDRFHLRRQNPRVRLIKLLDRVDNLEDMTGAPPDFKRQYAIESLLLLGAIEGDFPEVETELLRLAKIILKKDGGA